MHPSKKIPKTYLVKVKGILDDDEVERLKTGIKLGYKLTSPAQVKKLSKTDNNSWLEITIHEGRKRQIRKMLEIVRHPVIKLKRIRINGLEMGALEPGEYRYLSGAEIKKFKTEIIAC
jgi:23S rRNA pseudouridine2605 synthase